MRALREITGGLLLAALTTLAVIGGLFLALSESGKPFSQPTAIAGVFTPLPSVPSDSPVPSVPSVPSLPTVPPSSPTPDPQPPTPTHSPVPSASPSLISNLQSPTPIPQPLTRTPTPCGPPPNWVYYTVRPGDTLFGLSLRFKVSMQQLQLANCLIDTNLKYGQPLLVPFMPTNTPTLTPTSHPPSPTPIPESLQIVNIALHKVARDPSRPSGAIAFVYVEFTGGLPPYLLYHDGVPQPANPIQALTDCDSVLTHTVRVDSADGQTASKPYYFSPITCP